MMFLVALPSLCSMLTAFSDIHPSEPDASSDSAKGFNYLLIDLLDEGLIKKGHTGLIFGSGSSGIEDDLGFLRDVGIHLLTGSDLQMKKLVVRELFDFVITTSSHMVQQIDAIVKDGGLVVSLLAADPAQELRMLTSYKLVYVRRFDNTIVAMRKARAEHIKEVYNGITPDKKTTALIGLEDVNFEPSMETALGIRSTFT